MADDRATTQIGGKTYRLEPDNLTISVQVERFGKPYWKRMKHNGAKTVAVRKTLQALQQTGDGDGR